MVSKIYARWEAPDPDALAQERWSTSFSFLARKRFLPETTADYQTYSKGKDYTLELKRGNLFAWSLSSLYRYSDFVIEAELAFGRENGYSAVGLVLRQVSDRSFYYFLISNRGYFRFDLIFNANPLPLIGWTPLPHDLGRWCEGTMPLRVICRDQSFSFFIDDEWIGEMDDETIAAGRYGFAAQNFDEKESAFFHLTRFVIESRPVEGEKIFLRWTAYVPVDSASRVNLARSFFDRGEFAAAVVQLKKAGKHKRATKEELLLLVEASIRLEQYEIALEAVEAVLAQDGECREALHEKANLLYLMNRLEEAAHFIQSVQSKLEDNANIWSLMGNVRFSLGHWDDAVDAYRKAVRLNPDLPLHKINLAKALDTAGRKAEALDLYLDAGHMFFQQEAFEDVADLLPRIKRIDPRNSRFGALEGKLFFYEGRKEDARRIFQYLIDIGFHEDSSVFFLLGLIVAERGDRQRAAELFRKALDVEPDVPVYRLRLAETLFLSGEYAGREIAEAHRLDPDNAWVNNLYGQFCMRRAELDRAASYFEKAFEALPQQPEMALNFSECLFRQGNLERAMGVLDEAIGQVPDAAALHNQSGNIFAAEKKLTEARVAYERALELDPHNPACLKNCASVCIELDMILRAEKLLARLIDLDQTPECYNLIAHLALVKKEFERAEAALQEGLKQDPANSDLNVNLSRLYFERKRTEDAKRVLEDVLERCPEDKKAADMLERIHRDVDVQVRCAACGRVWWVPGVLPPQAALEVHGQPPMACPAGRCSRCDKVYCIACARKQLEGSRLVCTECREPLRVSDDALKYLVARYVADAEGD